MTTFSKSREWIDELDSARAVLHNNLPLSNAFVNSPSLQEATVVITSIGDMIRGSVVPITEDLHDTLDDVIPEMDSLENTGDRAGSTQTEEAEIPTDEQGNDDTTVLNGMTGVASGD